MRSHFRLFRSALRFSPCLLLAASMGTTACGSTPPPSGTGGASSGGSGAAPSTGGASATGGASSTGGTSSGGSGSGGASSGGATSTGGAGSGGAASGGTGSGGDGSGGGSQAVFTCPEGSESMAPTLSGTPMALPGTLPPVPGGGSNAIMEGPVWIDGALYMSQMRDYGPLNPSQILKHDGSSYTPFLPDSLTNGLALRADGMILAASHGVGGLVEIDPAASSPSATTVIDEYMSNRLISPNDLVIRSDGNVYLTDPKYQCGDPCETQTDQRVYRLPPGANELEPIPTSYESPNGITLSLDETKLYVAGDGIAVYTLDTSGAVTAGPDPFAALSKVDGLAIDCAGNIYAAANGELSVVDPAGTPIGNPIMIPNSATNVAFGGAGGTTLYITTMQDPGVYSLDVGIPGSPY